MQGWWSKAGTEQKPALPTRGQPQILLHVPMGGPVAMGVTLTALGQDHAPEPASSVTVTLFFQGGNGASYPRDHSRLLPGPLPFLLFRLEEERIILCHRNLLLVPNLSPNVHLWKQT